MHALKRSILPSCCCVILLFVRLRSLGEPLSSFTAILCFARCLSWAFGLISLLVIRRPSLRSAASALPVSGSGVTVRREQLLLYGSLFVRRRLFTSSWPIDILLSPSPSACRPLPCVHAAFFRSQSKLLRGVHLAYPKASV